MCGDSDGGSAFGTIAGRVTDAATGTGITGAGLSTDRGQSGTTDGNGDYSIANVPVGNRTVSVTANGFDPDSRAVSVTEAATSTADFALNASSSGGTGMIKGTVYSSTGGKLGGVQVQVVGGSSANTNKGGKYTIQNVEAGPQTVLATTGTLAIE